MAPLRALASDGAANFNGAMAVRPWMEVWGKDTSAAGSDFNGAMAVRPWMAAVHRLDGRNAALQWGHGREAMDGDPRALPPRRRRPTSMGPWP